MQRGIVVATHVVLMLNAGTAVAQPTSAPWPPKAPSAAAPATASETPAPTQRAESRIESYPLTGATREVLLAWQREAQGRSDLRVAIDERSAQALVFGPTTVHEQIRRQIFQAQPAPGANATLGTNTPPQPLAMQAGAAPAAPASHQAPSAEFRLQHLATGDLHSRLERLLSRPLPVTNDATGRWLSFPIETAPGVAVTVNLNPGVNVVRIDGPAAQVAAWRSVVAALDSPASTDGAVTQLVTTKPASQERVRKALQVLQAQNIAPSRVPAPTPPDTSLVSMLFQPQATSSEESAPTSQDQAEATEAEDTEPKDTQDAASEATTQQTVPLSRDAARAVDAAQLAEQAAGLLGPVQVEFVEGLDVIVLRGAERDVQRVMEIINQIEQLSAVTVPAIEVYALQNVDSESMARLLNRLYQQVLGPRIGEVSITALVKPNSLLLIGRAENVRMAIELVKRLDQPVPPTTRFEVFPLKNASAAEAKTLIDEFLQQEEGAPAPAPDAPVTLAPQALVVADIRTNSLIVSAGPRDLAEIAALVAKIDASSAAAVDVVRVFPLKNAIATEVAETLQNAITGDEQPAQNQQPQSRPSALEFLTIGGQLRSGVLTNVRITADPRGNAIVVTAPADSMDLIAALIAQLDQAPSAIAELKVFTLTNGDATALAEVLRTLFSADEDQDTSELGGVGQSGLVRLQFSVDQRTNSIIAAGTRTDLAVVEAILLRLDEGDVRNRQTTVHRLNNAFAVDVANAVNQVLQTEREVEAEAEVALSPFAQMEREVIVVPEPATNSLIVSATPRYYDHVIGIIRDLDERPPMVMIQVLIAEVRMNDTDEFGVELGLQDSLLFDRSLLGEFNTITTTTQTQSVGGATVSTTQQNIVNAPGSPGFNFNNPSSPLGNNLSTAALATAGQVAAQGLSSFALNRLNPELGFGGLILSASSNSVSVLLRALQENRRLEVLSRPQIMALDGQLGQVQVGQDVPTITSSSITEFGQINSIQYRPVGLILQVLPRISPDGLVVMQIVANKSEVGPEAEGIPITINTAGQILRAPRIENTIALTTVSALSGQTVVLSGLLSTRKLDIHRSVPIISDIPLIGDLFRYDAVSEERRELLIILTPQIVHDRIDAERLKQVESSRMSWILSDVVALNGPSGLRSRCDEWYGFEADTVYPTCVPEGGAFAPYPNGAGPSIETGEAVPIEGPMIEMGPVETAPTTLPPIEGNPAPTPILGPPTPPPPTPLPTAQPLSNGGNAVAPTTTAQHEPRAMDSRRVQPATYLPPTRLPQPTK